MARLRGALDELTAGAEPNAARLPATLADRRRRWMLPAVAAAAVAVVVGVAIAVAGRDDGGTPAAPTPTGPPVTPAPPPAATIPWYELHPNDGSPRSAPVDIGAGIQGSQVWAAPDYSRVLSASVTAWPNASTRPEEWPVVEPIADPPVGVAWSFRGDDPASNWHGVYWAPDDETAVIVTGVGFTPHDLAALLPALSVERDAAGPRVVSALASLVPVPFGTGALYVGRYELESRGFEPATADLYISDGPGVPLTMYASGATSITSIATPFGDGFRMEMAGDAGDVLVTRVWWQVDGGPFWAGLSAPSDRIDDLLTRLVRVANVAAPGPIPPPVEPSGPPVTAVVGCTAPSPHALATSAPSSDGAPSPTTTTSTTSVSCAVGPTTTLAEGPGLAPTTSAAALGAASTAVPTSWDANEPAMTAAVPSSFPGAGWRPPIAVGESVMLSAAASLGAAGITVYAEPAVQAVDIAEDLERLRAIDAFGDVVIIQVGTNGTVRAADLDRIVAAVVDVERVVVLTAHADRSWIAPNNELIRALPARYPNVKVVDWDQIATENPDILTSDGIHVEDRQAYADAIVQAYQD